MRLGRPVTVAEVKDNVLVYHKEEVESILQHEKIKDRKIVIVSIDGAIRQGKDFYLDSMLRLLYDHVSLHGILDRFFGNYFGKQIHSC